MKGSRKASFRNSPAVYQTLTVLVVDDRQHDLEMVRRLLTDISGISFEIYSTRTPDEAREILNRRSIDVLILDHNLSSITGSEFLAEENLHQQLPVLVISGFLNGDEARELYEQGTYTYLDKENLTPHTLQIGISNSIYRHRLEQNLRQSLRHKDLLLKEVHHRVKNNMQLISSLLGLQANSLNDEKSKQILNDSKRRVQSLGLVHRMLYEHDDFSSVEAGKFLKNLVEEIRRSFTSIEPEISFLYEMDSEVQMGLDTAIPCSLIVNELVTNALRHATQDETESHQIKIRLHQPEPGHFDLSVSDDGPGLPVNFDPRNADSLGLPLVFRLAEQQLDAEVDYDSSNGTTFRIQFPAREHKTTETIFDPEL